MPQDSSELVEPVTKTTYAEFDTAMTAKCSSTWSRFKTQREDRLDQWSTESIFNAQLRLPASNMTVSYILQDFILARIPAAYYYIHLRGSDKKPRFSNNTCKMYAVVYNHLEAGLGHRMSNFLQGALIAETFELEHIVENMDLGIETSVHGAYDGITEFLGIIKPGDAIREDMMDCTLKTFPQIRYEAGTLNTKFNSAKILTELI
jgi:hypothetical protein